MANCDSCVYNVYDDDDECYYCEVDMDEDDAARLMQGHYKECPYYQNDESMRWCGIRCKPEFNWRSVADSVVLS